MTVRTEQEKYFEEEAESLQDSTERRTYFKNITFENVGRARRLLKKLRGEMNLMDALILELEEKIQDYEDWVDIDNLMAMEVK